MKFESKCEVLHWIKWSRKCRLQNGWHFYRPEYVNDFGDQNKSLSKKQPPPSSSLLGMDSATNERRRYYETLSLAEAIPRMTPAYWIRELSVWNLHSAHIFMTIPLVVLNDSFQFNSKYFIQEKKPMGIQTTKPTTSKKIWTQLNIMKNVTFNFTNIIHRTCEQLIIIRSVNNPDRGRPQIGGQPPIEVHHTSIGDGLSGSKLLQENAYFSDCNNNCDWQRRMEIPRRSGLFL